MPKKSATPTVTYSVRLTAADKAWLEETSKRLHVPVPTLLVWAIDALRQYAQAHAGSIPAPVNIKTLWQIAQTNDPRGLRYDSLIREDEPQQMADPPTVSPEA